MTTFINLFLKIYYCNKFKIIPLKEALVFPTKASKKGDIVTNIAKDDYDFTTFWIITFVAFDKLK